MKKKKIAVLHAQVPFVRGGAEQMVETLVRELRNRAFDAELVSMPFRWYPQNGIYDNMLSWRLLDLTEINGETIDLVIPTKFPTYGVKHPNKVLWLMHQHRVAYDLYDDAAHFGLGSVENGHEIRDKIINFDNLTLKEAKKIYSISKNVSHRLDSNNGLKSEVLYHPPALAGQYYCDQYDDYILSVGRLDPLKRIDLLISALKYCDKTVQVKIAGNGPELESLKKLARDNNVEQQVQFLGFVTDDELLKLYANARAVYFAPVDEDYGYVTLEAFLSRKPVITCDDAGGVLEFAVNEKSALVCEPEAHSVAEAMVRMSGDLNYSKELGTEGYNIVKDISWDTVIDALTFNI